MSELVLVSKEQVAELWGCSADLIHDWEIDDLNRCLDRFDITTPARVCHFMSQGAHETGGGRWFTEQGGPDYCAQYDSRTDLGNDRPGDGFKFRGCGYIHCTGRGWAELLFKETKDNNVLEVGTDYSAKNFPFLFAGLWWEANKMNSRCDGGNSVAEITRVVNGGANGLADREMFFARATNIWAKPDDLCCNAPEQYGIEKAKKARAAGTFEIKALVDTFAKKRTDPAISLPDNEKAFFEADKTFPGCVQTDQRDGHSQVELPYGLGAWWLFNGHWQGLADDVPSRPALQEGVVNLNVPQWVQTDNYTQASRTCNSSSCAMCLEFLKPGTLPGGDDQYLKRLIDGGYGDTTDHAAHTRLLLDYGLKSEFSYAMSMDEVEAELRVGNPVVAGILHRGTEAYPTGGHMIVVKGLTKTGDWVVNDPYGNIYDGYSGAVDAGMNAIYKKSSMQARWLPDGPNSGWGRIFHP